MQPIAVVVAGPSGSGKSTHFPVREFGLGSFNVDDRCAELNHGSYQRIPDSVRRQAQLECERFIDESIAGSRSFAVETTLRTLVPVEQAQRARAAGFHTRLIFIASDDVEENVRRVTERAFDGGHGAPFQRIREIYRSSLANLPSALPVFHEAFLYDSSAHLTEPRLVRRYENGRIAVDHPPPPTWLTFSAVL